MVSLVSLGGAMAALRILETKRSKPWRCAAYFQLTCTAADLALSGYRMIYRATVAYDDEVAKKKKMEGISQPEKESSLLKTMPVPLLRLGGVIGSIHVLRNRSSKPMRCVAYSVIAFTGLELTVASCRWLRRTIDDYEREKEEEKNK